MAQSIENKKQEIDLAKENVTLEENKLKTLQQEAQLEASALGKTSGTRFSALLKSYEQNAFTSQNSSAVARNAAASATTYINTAMGQAGNFSLINPNNIQSGNQALKGLQEQLSILAQEGVVSNKVVEEFNRRVTGVGKATGAANAHIKDYLNYIKTQIKWTANSSKTFLEEAKALGVNTKKIEAIIKQQEKLAEAKRKVDTTSEEYKNMLKEEAALNERLQKEINETVSSLNNSTSPQLTRFQQMGKTFQGTLQSVSSLTMGFTSLGSVISTLQDPDMSAWDKFSSVAMSLSIGLPMLVSGVTALHSTLMGSNVITKLLASGLKKLNAQQVVTNVLGKTSNNLKVKQKALDEIHIINQQRKLAGEKRLTAEETKQIILQKIKQASMWKVYLIIIAVVAVIALLVAGYKAMQAASPEGQLKAATEAAKQSQEAYDNLKSSVDNLKSSFEDWKTAKDNIEDLKKGTKEWRDAIDDANNKAIELLTTYPELSQYMTTGEGGLIEFSETGMDAVFQNKQDQLLNSQQINLVAQANKLEKAFELKKDQFAEKENAWRVYTSENLDNIFSLIETDGAISLTNKDKLREAIVLAEDGQDDKYSAFFEAILNNIQEDSDKLLSLYNEQKATTAATQASQGAIVNAIVRNKGLEEGATKEEQDAYSTDLENATKFFDEGKVKTGKGSSDWWHEHDNYDDIAGGERQIIIGEGEQARSFDIVEVMKEFMGDENASYIAQRNGEMVFETSGGEEKKFGRETVQSALINAYAAEVLETSVSSRQAAQSILSEDTNNAYGKAVQGDYTDLYLGQLSGRYQSTDTTKKAYGNLVGGTDIKQDIQEKLTRTIYVGEEITTEQLVDEDAAYTAYEEIISKIGVQGKSFLDDILSNSEITDTTKQDIIENLGDGLDISALLNISGLTPALKEELKKLQKEEKKIQNDKKKDLKVTNKEYENAVKQIKAANKGLDENSEEFDELVEKQIAFNHGIRDSAKDFQDLNDKISDSSVTFEDYDEFAKSLIDSGMFGEGAADVLDAQYIQDNWDLITQAMNGSADAYEKLYRDINSKKLVIKYKEFGLSETHFDSLLEASKEPIAINTVINADTSPFYKELEGVLQALIAAGMSYEEITSAFEDYGFELTTTDGASGVTVSPDQVELYREMGYRVVGTENGMFTMVGKKIGFKKVKNDTTGNTKPFTNYTDDKGSKREYSPNKYEPKVTRYAREDAIIEGLEEQGEQLDYELQNANREAKDSIYPKIYENLVKQREEVQKKIDNIEASKALEIEYLQRINIKPIIDENGTLLNENEMYQQLAAYVDRLNAEYETKFKNATTDEQREALEEERDNRIKEAERVIEKLLEDLDLSKDEAQRLRDITTSIADNSMERINNNAERFKDNLEESRRTLDLMQKAIGDGFFGTNERLEVTMQAAQLDVSAYEEAAQRYNEILNNPHLTEEEREAGLRDAKADMDAAADAMLETRDYLMNATEETLSSAAEEMAKYSTIFERYNNELQHTIDLMNLAGRGADYKALNEFYKGQTELAKDQYEIAVEQYEVMEEYRVKAKEDYERALRSGSEEEIKIYEKAWLAAEAQATESYGNMTEMRQAYLEAAQTEYTNTIEMIAKEMEDKLTGNFGFDLLLEQIGFVADQQEIWLTTTNKIYETSKLIRTANQAIAQTESKYAKNRLTAFAQETKQLQSRGQLSNYELELQQKKYNLLLAEIALEDSRNATDKVRLHRDAQGNYMYVYTADENKISEAEQGVADAQNALYNYNLENANNFQEQMAQLASETKQQLIEVYSDTSLDPKERQRKVEQIQKSAIKKYGDLFALNNIALEELGMNSVDTYFSFLQQNLTSSDMFAESLGLTIKEMNQSFKDYTSEVESAAPNVTDSYSEIRREVQGITSDSKELKDVTLDLVDSVEDSLADFNKSFNTYVDKWIEQVNALIAKIKSLYDIINQGAEGSGGQNISSADKDSGGLKAGTTNERYTPTTQGADQAWGNLSRDLSNNKGATAQATIAKQAMNSGVSSKDVAAAVAVNNGITVAQAQKWVESLNTGGYTGKFGPEGRWALLHEKELVLNKADTANILASVEIMRSIVNSIDMRAAQAQLGLWGLGIPQIPAMAADTVEQNVHIEAEFPNVTDHNEIEEAFNNLINTAAQYANRK